MGMAGDPVVNQMRSQVRERERQRESDARGKAAPRDVRDH